MRNLRDIGIKCDMIFSDSLVHHCLYLLSMLPILYCEITLLCCFRLKSEWINIAVYSGGFSGSKNWSALGRWGAAGNFLLNIQFRKFIFDAENIMGISSSINMRAHKIGMNTVNMVSNKDISQNLYMSSVTFKLDISHLISLQKQTSLRYFEVFYIIRQGGLKVKINFRDK
jgi:hypothetical protein